MVINCSIIVNHFQSHTYIQSIHRDDITSAHQILETTTLPRDRTPKEIQSVTKMADPEVDLFAGMKKKKKKQVALDLGDSVPAEEHAEKAAPAAVEEQSPVPPPAAIESPAPGGDDSGAATPAAGDAPAEDGGDLFADLKKKKKKKKDIPLDLDAADGSAAPAATPDGLDVPIKKKKSKKQATDFARELDELDAEQNEEDASNALPVDDNAVTGENGEKIDAWVAEGRGATYPELLRRFFTMLHQHNPELAGEKRRFMIVPPQVAREGTKKTMFANITDICRRMHRQPEHVIQFLYAELGTQGSVDGNQRLIMKGRFTQKQIENVLRKYIVEYVTCKVCKSPDTLLGKENRLYFMTCESCGSRLSVSAIKAGYQAQVGKRIKPA